MDQSELRAKLDEVLALVAKEMPVAKTPEEVKFASFLLIGLSLGGELLLDIKRIADGAENPIHHFHAHDNQVLSAIGNIVCIKPLEQNVHRSVDDSPASDGGQCDSSNQ